MASLTDAVVKAQRGDHDGGLEELTEIGTAALAASDQPMLDAIAQVVVDGAHYYAAGYQDRGIALLTLVANLPLTHDDRLGLHIDAARAALAHLGLPAPAVAKVRDMAPVDEENAELLDEARRAVRMIAEAPVDERDGWRLKALDLVEELLERGVDSDQIRRVHLALSAGT